MTKRLARLILVLLIVFMNIGCDQGTKSIARSRLKDAGTVFLVADVLVLQYVENTGAFLSLGSRLPEIVRRIALIGLPIVVLSIIAVFLLRKKEVLPIVLIGLAFIAGGGGSNLIDRIRSDGRVGDFINIGIGGIRTGIFNLADLSILVGCALLLIAELSKAKRGDRRPGSRPA
jgi:signal peptidase II